ncbi:c-type cytochrome [Yeosuana sp. AK3]
MKKIFQFLLVTGLSLMTFSCYYDELADQTNLPLPQNISFQNQVQPVFNQNCANCHNGSQNPDLRSGNSFTALIGGNFVIPSNSENSILYKSLIGQGAPLMPPSGGISQTKINIIKQWIDEGALNN